MYSSILWTLTCSFWVCSSLSKTNRLIDRKWRSRSNVGCWNCGQCSLVIEGYNCVGQANEKNISVGLKYTVLFTRRAACHFTLSAHLRICTWLINWCLENIDWQIWALHTYYRWSENVIHEIKDDPPVILTSPYVIIHNQQTGCLMVMPTALQWWDCKYCNCQLCTSTL